MKKKLVIPIGLALFCITATIFFTLGLFWQTIYHGYFGKNDTETFNCFSFSNIHGVFQTNCFFPSLTAQKPFVFKNTLTCKAITNQQLGNLDAAGHEMQGTAREILLSKSDSVTFSLDFEGDTIRQSLQPGQQKTEAYTVIKNTDDIIQATRPVKKENFTTSDSYDFMTFSKTTGKGIEVWHNVANFQNMHNSDSIGSFFFQCK